MAFGFQVTNLATDSALLIDVWTFGLDVVSTTTAVALRIGRAGALQVPILTTVVTDLVRSHLNSCVDVTLTT